MPSPAVPSGDPGPFSPLELLVVEIARHEPRRFPRLRGCIGSVANLLLGVKPTRSLANPQLEALRLLVVAQRYRLSFADAVLAARSAGVGEAQIDYLTGSQVSSM
jgi:hypothetical protein